MATGGDRMEESSQDTLPLDGVDWNRTFVQSAMSGDSSSLVPMPTTPPNAIVVGASANFMVDLPRAPRKIRIGKWIYLLQQDVVV